MATYLTVNNIFKDRPPASNIINGIVNHGSKGNKISHFKYFMSFFHYFLSHIINITGLNPFKRFIYHKEQSLDFYNHLVRLLWCQSRSVALGYDGSKALSLCYVDLPTDIHFLCDEFPAPIVDSIRQFARICYGKKLGEYHTLAYHRLSQEKGKEIGYFTSENLFIMRYNLIDELKIFTSFSHYLIYKHDKEWNLESPRVLAKVFNRYYQKFYDTNKWDPEKQVRRCMPIKPDIVTLVIRNIGKHMFLHRKFQVQYQEQLNTVTTIHQQHGDFTAVKNLFEKYPITTFELFVDNMELYLRYIETTREEENPTYIYFLCILHIIYAFRNTLEICYFNVVRGIPELKTFKNIKNIRKSDISNYYQNILGLHNLETQFCDMLCLDHIVARFMHDQFNSFIEFICLQYMNCSAGDIFQDNSAFKDLKLYNVPQHINMQPIKLFTFDIEPIYMLYNKSETLSEIYKRCCQWSLDAYNFISYLRLSPRAASYCRIVEFKHLKNSNKLHSELGLIDEKYDEWSDESDEITDSMKLVAPPKRITSSYMHCPLCYLAIWSVKNAPIYRPDLFQYDNNLKHVGCVGYFYKNWQWPRFLINNGYMLKLFLGKDAFNLLLDIQRLDETEVNHISVQGKHSKKTNYSFLDSMLYIITRPRYTMGHFNKSWKHSKVLVVAKPNREYNPESFYYHHVLNRNTSTLAEFCHPKQPKTIDTLPESFVSEKHHRDKIPHYFQSDTRVSSDDKYQKLIDSIKSYKTFTLQKMYAIANDTSGLTPTYYENTDDASNDTDNDIDNDSLKPLEESLQDLHISSNENTEKLTTQLTNILFLLNQPLSKSTFDNDYQEPYMFFQTIFGTGTSTISNSAFTITEYQEARNADEQNRDINW